MFSFLTDLFKPKPPVAPPITSETSMSVGLVDIGPFFTVLSNNGRFGLPSELSDFMKAEVATLKVEDTKRWKISGDFDGSAMDVEIEVFLDERDEALLSFFSSKSVIDEVEKELTAFAENMGR
ncbi:MAG: hypothetical protein AAGA15_15845 [Pseudomonadota bacterium]